MAHLGNNSRDGTKQHAGHGHQAIIHPIDPPIPVGKPALHILPQARALHLLFAGPHADEVVALVEVEVEKGEQDADEAQGAVEGEGGGEQRVRLRRGHVGGVEHAGGEGDGEVGGEEVGFEEAVEEDEEFGFGEAGARVGACAGGVRGVDVGGGEGGAGGGCDPVGDAVEGAVLGEVGVSWLVFLFFEKGGRWGRKGETDSSARDNQLLPLRWFFVHMACSVFSIAYPVSSEPHICLMACL